MLIHIGHLFELVLSLIVKTYTYILHLKSFELDGALQYVIIFSL